MIIGIDIETKGLDATKFVYGCLIKENGAKKYFKNKEDMWKYIIELGKSEKKRGKMLNVYAHNHSYDFHGYADLSDPNIKYFCLSPFIVAYEFEGKEIIKFLDTMAIYRMSLKRVGDIVKLPKMEMPEELFNENTRVTEELLNKVKPYVTRDVEIVLKAVKNVKEMVHSEKIGIKRIYTINQIAINYMVNKIKESEELEGFWYNKKMGMVLRTKYKDLIHGAYRGGRVEAWQTGIIKDVTYIDCNSLYPYSAMIMRFPNLSTERFIKKPLELIRKKELFNKIGISRVLIKNESNEIGLIPVRTKNQSYIPKKDKYIIGTYSNEELKKAEEEGYRVEAIEWSIIYDDTYNPYRDIIPRLYELRKQNNNEFNDFFYKMIMNASFGKMAQKRVNQLIVMDTVEEVENYLSRNYEVIKGVGTNYMYSKKEVEFKPKKYYCPIIPTLINAKARIIMYDLYKKINPNNLIYTDTDSCMFEGEIPKNINIGKELGMFKVEEKGKEVILYGKKTYSIGDEIKVSGIRKKGITKEQFERGRIISKKMVTIKGTSDLKEAGKFKEEIRDLKEQYKEYEKAQDLLEAQDIYIDNDIENINFFIPYLNTPTL